MTKLKTILVFSFLCMLAGCTSSFETKKPTAPNSPQISTSGVWETCSIDDNTVDSQKILINIQGTVFDETISSYSNITDCSGTSSNEFSFHGRIDFNQLGQSQFESGATNVTLTIDDQDLFGCGVGVPAYTYLKIENNDGFNSAHDSPNCDPNNRGTGIGFYFTKTQQLTQ
jgi:hypothetical protein